MKKLNKKLVGVGLIVLFFSTALVFLVKAQVGQEYFFRVNSASTTQTLPRLPNQAVSSFPICLQNLSNKDYFAPNKTSPEWESFMNNLPAGVYQTNCCGDEICDMGETTSDCPDDCGTYESNCDSSPEGVYTGGIYYVQHGLVYSDPAPYPECGITSANLAGSNPYTVNTQNFIPDDGVGYKHTNCVALFKSVNKICNGDTCLTGIAPKIYEGNNSLILSPSFCYGEYDSSKNICEFIGAQNPSLSYGQAVVSGLPGINGEGAFTYSQSSSSVLTTKIVKTESTWGTCSTCGDGYCDISTGENTSCSADCYSGSQCNNNSICDSTEDCFGCSSDCGACGTEPIYRGVAYAAYNGSGTCLLYSPTYTFNNSNILINGGITRCASLIKSSNINNGDTCITGVQQISQLSPVYCVGQYNRQTNKCIYQQTATPLSGYLEGETLILKLNAANEAVWGNGEIMSPYDLTVGTWGRCSN